MQTFSTFKIAGAPVPKDRAIDGVDQTDFLHGKITDRRRNTRKPGSAIPEMRSPS
jgi:hypothetical protein